ncbi:hypothetical protein ACVWWO_000401 [Bradyrhizobium sp. F1.13.1]
MTRLPRSCRPGGAQKPQDLQFTGAHVRQRARLDGRTAQGSRFSQARRDEALSRCDFADRLRQEPWIVALRNIALDAHFDCAHHERRILGYAKNDDPGVRIVISDPACQLEPCEVGKPQIQHRDVGMVLQVRAVAGLRIGSFQYVDGSVPSEQGPASSHDHRMVVDDQYSHDDPVLIRTAVALLQLWRTS